MVWRCCAFGCRNRGGQRLGLGFYRFPFKNEGRLRRWIQVERIGSLRSTREYVAIICVMLVRSVEVTIE